MSDDAQYCTFRLGSLFFGVEVTKVQEVIRYQEMTPIPLAQRTVSGLINLRGQIVTAIDLRRVLEFEDRPADERPMNVVIRTDEGAVSLLVDRIGDVMHVDSDSFERVPDTVTGVARDLILGAYKLPDTLLLVLDTDRIVGSDDGSH
ncbi:chemotaxis protein CheW [Plasticicumulans sp.]|uniref:chemotaxis protein CheW n=1 Tax=Plasticicumulans sp. TaxID=2307179 RepID=UPI000F9CC9C0|nr:chemotaxis protein CheW [Plasticicumulans sp.]MBS0603241.1 chemotaxis protein CheW [Pseudomonadota bacterium]RTL06008.1 MAG: chemotaxis protein CheW [Xanthomonadales bacterium]HMV38384.1 chemotaxis protein CheW [Plasticicumulans sp.]HMW29057.1 chemotaxis protein CheW [Plasticicumulans sp.]HMW40990.1 chemotaxis protein CheW [Plasticicumulans sp.]